MKSYEIIRNHTKSYELVINHTKIENKAKANQNFLKNQIELIT